MVWSNRAACFLRLERWEKALQDAQIARTLDPKYVKVRATRGAALAEPPWFAQHLCFKARRT